MKKDKSAPKAAPVVEKALALPTMKGNPDDLRDVWRSLVITRVMAEGLLKIILRMGTETQKAIAYVVLHDALDKEEDWQFQVKLPKSWENGDMRVKVGEPRQKWRDCLKCGERTLLEVPFRLCDRCRHNNLGYDDTPPQGL